MPGSEEKPRVPRGQIEEQDHLFRISRGTSSVTRTYPMHVNNIPLMNFRNQPKIPGELLRTQRSGQSARCQPEILAKLEQSIASRP
jgi:hypothetical protein